MAKRTIVTMPGDGIGKVVLPESLRVLQAAGFEAEYVHGDIGWEFWCSEGNALPQRTIDLLEQHKIGLFGAITSKPKDKADAELSPALKGKGYTYYSPIVTMRQHFNLDICIPFHDRAISSSRSRDHLSSIGTKAPGPRKRRRRSLPSS